MQEFVCPKCGAPLTEQQAQRPIITCAHCGVVFERTKAKPRGGINLQVGGSLTISGDLVGGDSIRYHITQVTSDPNSHTPITIVTSGDLEIGGDIFGRNLNSSLPPPPPPSRWDRIRTWFSNLFRRPKR